MATRNLSFILLITILCFCSCENVQQKGKTPNYAKEIRKLKTNEDKRAYLEQIMEDDQRVRGTEGAKIMLSYGKRSKEYKAYVKAKLDQDSINLENIETYLNIHGYPGKELGEDATSAPWMVIHHAQGYETRERNFEIVYGAYLNGDIDDGSMSFYLGRMYQMKFGKLIDLESPFTPEEEINQLIEALELEEKRLKVEDHHNQSK
jgi:hypothetical protein